jgi:glutathione peroxidase
MNALVERFPSSKFEILAFPCNQFGHQENGNPDEILKSLQYLRPGDGFVPKATMMAKGDVNGKDAQHIFKFLRAALPYPCDRTHEMDMDQPYGAMKDDATTKCLWVPRSPSDIQWNFHKFIVDHHGIPRFSFSPKTMTRDLTPHIEKLLAEMGGE